MFKYRQITKLNVGVYSQRQEIELSQKKKVLLKTLFCMRYYFIGINNYLLTTTYINHRKSTFRRSTKNLCDVTLKARGVYRSFKMARLAVHEKARLGLLLGVTKSSW